MFEHRLDETLHLLGQTPVLLGPLGDLLRHLSVLFGPIRHQVGEAFLLLEQLPERAGQVVGEAGDPFRQLGQGIYSYLPLGWRVMQKIEQIMREEMDAVEYALSKADWLRPELYRRPLVR